MTYSDKIVGFFPWNWVPDPTFGGFSDTCMVPRYKIAEGIFRYYYDSTIDPLPKPNTPPKCKCTI
jgi:hypothetical protein